MKKTLPQRFYDRNTLDVAKDLLGKFLVYEDGKRKFAGRIIETEAYMGFDDRASHASKGITPRTALMYGRPGYWYIYLIYGFYLCLNVVAGDKNYPAAVLIRAVEPTEGIEEMHRNRASKKGRPCPFYNLTSGPGKLCQAFGIKKSLNGSRAFGKGGNLYIEDRGEKIKKTDIVSAKRIGVDYAGEWKDKKWRFYIRDSKFVSKR